MQYNTGDTAWILASAALVLLMTPGLAFFYGGMVRGNFRIEGDTVSAFSHFWAVTRMLDIFRELQNK